MPRISNIEILKKEEQPTIFIRTRTKAENLPALIGGSYGKMTAYLKETGEFLSDVPFVAYHNMDMQDLDVEIGMPVAKLLPGKGEIRAGFVPAGKYVFCMYRGAYSEMGEVYGEMADWIGDNNYEPVGTAYEYYYNGQEYPESELLTMVVMPVK